MKITLQVVLIVFVSLLSSCASLPDTPSGNPELILKNVRFDCVRSVFLNGFINQGYTVRNASNTQIVAGRTAKNAPIWYHSFYGGAPEERVTIHFFPLDTPGALHIVSTAAYVSNPATASEKVYATQGTQEDHEQLMALQSIIEKQCRN